MGGSRGDIAAAAAKTFGAYNQARDEVTSLEELTQVGNPARNHSSFSNDGSF